MGKVKSSEEIQAPEAISEAKAPKKDEPITSLPPNSQVRSPRVATFPPESPPGETVVAFPPEPRGGETTVAFPPELGPGRVEEINPVEVAQHVGVLPQIPTQPPPPIGNPWSTGLFDCNQDPTNAVMTALFPCVTFGQIAEVLDAGTLTCPVGSFIYVLMMPAVCSSWIVGSKYRTKLRMRFGLVEAPYNDVFSHVFCPFCSLCQEFRELKKRA